MRRSAQRTPARQHDAVFVGLAVAALVILVAECLFAPTVGGLLGFSLPAGDPPPIASVVIDFLRGPHWWLVPTAAIASIVLWRRGGWVAVPPTIAIVVLTLVIVCGLIFVR